MMRMVGFLSVGARNVDYSEVRLSRWVALM